MALIDYVLGQQNLQQLGPDVQDQARSEGYRRFILGSLLGGKGLASGYAAAQEVIPGIQAAQRQQQINQAVQKSMVNLGVKPGSQLDLLQSQMGDLEDPTNRTAAALQRNVQQKNAAPGMGGTGLSASQQMLQRFDPSLFAKNIPGVLAGQDSEKALTISKMGAPDVMESTGLQLDPFTKQIVGAIPIVKDNVRTIYNEQTGKFEATPVVGALNAKAAVTPPPLSAGQQYVFDANQNVVGIMNAAGAVQALGEVKTVEALGSAAGQTIEVYDSETKKTKRVPLTTVTGTAADFAGNLRPATPGVTVPKSGAQPGSAVVKPTFDAETLNAASRESFLSTGKAITENASSAGTRKYNAEEVFELAQTLDPSKWTEFMGNVSPYLGMLPGVGEDLKRFNTNYALFAQQYNKSVTTQMAGPGAKGNLNENEVKLFKGSTWQESNPKESTQYIAALEAARADKDLARQGFYEKYISSGGDPAKFNTEWAKSPENSRLYDHPLMNKFVDLRIKEGLSRGPGKDGKPEFLLPPGYKALGIDRQTNGIIVVKPDGTKYIAQ